MSFPVALAVLILLGSSAKAGSFNASARGTTTADFLTLGAGARAAGMGRAYSAVADEASALYWNPAAMTQVEKRSVTLMHAPYIDPSYIDYGAYAQRFGPNAFGLGAQFFSAGSISQTDATGADAGHFSPYDFAVSAGYARRIVGFALGLSGNSSSRRSRRLRKRWRRT